MFDLVDGSDNSRTSLLYLSNESDDDGKTRHVWEGGEMVQAVAHDCPGTSPLEKSNNSPWIWKQNYKQSPFVVRQTNP